MDFVIRNNDKNNRSKQYFIHDRNTQPEELEQRFVLFVIQF